MSDTFDESRWTWRDDARVLSLLAQFDTQHEALSPNELALVIEIRRLQCLLDQDNTAMRVEYDFTNAIRLHVPCLCCSQMQPCQDGCACQRLARTDE